MEPPAQLVVFFNQQKTRSEILSELMWLDDLKQFKQTVCEPNVSLRGNILEEFEVDGRNYRASMFRTARGVIKTTTDMTPLYFICVGDLLGAIHHVSTDERQLGIKYKRKSKAADFAAQKCVWPIKFLLRLWKKYRKSKHRLTVFRKISDITESATVTST